MVSEMMVRDILLFSGQGSALSIDRSSLLSTSVTARQCLYTFHNSLVAEVDSLPTNEEFVVSEIAACFPEPGSLVHPVAQNNPIVQSVSLYVHQILEYISYAEKKAKASDTSILEALEIVGFCSGVLPAVVISTCPFTNSTEFLKIAVAGLRLAFWTGLRSLLFCQSVTRDWRDQAWSLTVQGLNMSELQKLVSEYNETKHTIIPLQVSAILSERVISVAGPGNALDEFKRTHLAPSASSRYANIHGYYHGGAPLKQVLNQLLEDVKRRQIPFPSWAGLRIPVRSTVDGIDLDSSRSSPCLLESVLENILIHRADWQTTSQLLLADTSARLTRDIHLRCNIISIGPNSGYLMNSFKSTPNHPRLHVNKAMSNGADGPSMDDIAIVGMSVNFPSGKGPAQLWDTLEQGLNVVEEIPFTRFKVSGYHQDNDVRDRPRKMKARHGNFLDDPFAFDNVFFQISPREAKAMDPQQRLLLHAALEAMEDAGYVPDSTPSFSTETIGVYVGCATLDYLDNARNDIDVYYSPGTLRAFLSGRLSYAFQLMGPSVVIDTACSSSTVALYQACRAIQAGDCTSALAGGVNVISSPDMYLGLSRAHFLSQTGQCKPFDSSADGYCRSEGCGLFMLKKLSDAVAEKDRIYGVIRGVEVNQCGTAKSITHPDADTQAILFQRLLTKAKIDPNTIGVVEAHGTGTQAGDFAEVTSLQSVFGTNRPSSNPLLLSSIKGNIGHPEAASGAAGLAKLLLMLQRKQIPRQAAHQLLNPRLRSMIDHNILVPTKNIAWRTAGSGPRRALLNNFGAAGSNAAIIVEENTHIPFIISGSPERSCHLLNISAKTTNALQILQQGFCTYLKGIQSSSQLASMCYSSNARRQEFNAFRISVSGSSPGDMLRALHLAKVSPKVSLVKGALTAFVFSGQGGIYPGMGAELLSTAPIFRENVELCNAMLEDLGYPVVDALIGEVRGADLHVTDPLNQIVVSQCACFVLEYCIAQLWMSWGVVPDVVTGHSIGEYAALATTGVLSLRDALILVAERAKLMAALCQQDSTGMAACSFAASEVKSLMSSFEGLTVACKNSTYDCVVAGPLAPLKRFVDFCKSLGKKAKMLDVPFAFHSDAMNPILEPLAEVVATLAINSPKIPLVSSYLGRITDKEDFCVQNFVGHTREPVEFVRASEALAEFALEKELNIIEIGPSPISLSLIKTTLKNVEATYLPSLKPKEKPWTTLSSALSSLFLRRIPVQWRQVYAGLDAQFLPDIPCYPLAPARFIIPFVEPAPFIPKQDMIALSSTRRFLDGSQRITPDGQVFGSKLSLLTEFIKAHNVAGVELCPASVYIELALEAHEMIPTAKSQFRTLADLTFDKPLVYSDTTNDMNIRIHFTGNNGSFRIISGDNTIHSAGSVAQTSDEWVIQDFVRRASYVKRQLRSICFDDRFSTRILYDVIFPRVVAYSGPYITIKQLSVASSGLEGSGTFQLPASGHDGFVCPPAFTDTLLHAAGFVANSKINAGEACICVKVERVIVASPDTPYAALYNCEMDIYCGLIECSSDLLIGDAYALDKSGNVLACVEGMHFKRLRLKAFQGHLARTITTSTKPQQKPGLQQPRSDNTGQLGKDYRNSQDSCPTDDPMDTNLRQILYCSISDTCGIALDDIDESTRLSDIGVDSLLIIELTGALQHQFPRLNLSGSDFASCETVSHVEGILAAAGAVQGDFTPSASVSPDLSPAHTTPTNGLSIDFRRVNELFEAVCGLSLHGIDKDTTLSSLGVDSLLAIELTAGFHDKFGIELDNNIISDLSILALEERIFSHSPEPLKQQKRTKNHGSDDVTELEDPIMPGLDTCPVPLQKSRTADEKRSPLFLFHDGSGLCNVYSRLGDLERDVYGIFSIDLSNVDSSIMTLEELASRYVDWLKLTSKSDIILAGWSFGGVLAFAVSRELRRRGNMSVRGIVLIDSPAPVSHEPLPQAIISHIYERIPAQTPATHRIRCATEAQFQRNARLLGGYNPSPAQGPDTAEDVPCVMLKCKDSFDAEGLCKVSYPWLSDDEIRLEGVKTWESLVGRPVLMMEVSGNHFDLFSPENIGNFSLQLKKACRMLEHGE